MSADTLRGEPADILAEFGRRLEALEARLGIHEPDGPYQVPPETDSSTGHSLSLLTALFTRRDGDFATSDMTGGVAYVGSLVVNDKTYQWAREAGIGGIARTDPAALARFLSAIASPIRIILLRHLLVRDRTSGELIAELGGVSAGQVYHHLNELQAVGVLIQVRRGVYRISPATVIPFLIVLVGAADGVRNARVPAHQPAQAVPESIEPPSAPITAQKSRPKPRR